MGRFQRQRSTQDFSLNEALRNYLKKTKVNWENCQERRAFASLVDIPDKSLSDILKDKKQIGPQLQARLFVKTDDACFAPRDELERMALDDWEKNPTAPKCTAQTGGKAPAKSSHPETPYYLNDRLIALFEKYEITKRRGREYRLITAHTKMHETVYRDLLAKKRPLTAIAKVRIFLGFADSEFKPLDRNEKFLCETWREQIPTPLPFIKIEKREQDSVAAETPAAAAIPLSAIAQSLLANESFITQLAVKIQARVKMFPVPEEAPSAPIPDGEVVPAKFIEETAELLRETNSKLKTITSIGNTQRKVVQTELDTLFKELESALTECWLLARALSRTVTREAVFKMIEGERSFIDKFRRSSLADKQ
ncbi:hypothetical protein HZB94_01315 [Candidatus Falkowbacteria bacterium]|nr:hypothetical protein [Candidatus Falkowbacteria bacterium]